MVEKWKIPLEKRVFKVEFRNVRDQQGLVVKAQLQQISIHNFLLLKKKSRKGHDFRDAKC